MRRTGYWSYSSARKPGPLGSWLMVILGIFMMAILCTHPQIVLLLSLCIHEFGSVTVEELDLLWVDFVSFESYLTVLYLPYLYKSWISTVFKFKLCFLLVHFKDFQKGCTSKDEIHVFISSCSENVTKRAWQVNIIKRNASQIAMGCVLTGTRISPPTYYLLTIMVKGSN